MTDCITEYINFCEQTILPAKTVNCFPNNKPWITSDLKTLLNKKKEAFKSGDKSLLKSIQHELRDKLRRGRDSYRKKLEAKLQQNNSRDVWAGMKAITGFKGRDRLTVGTLERANELNTFFHRFSSLPAAVSSTSTSHLTSSSQPGVSIAPLLNTYTSHLSSTTQPGFCTPPLLTLPLTPPPLCSSCLRPPPPPLYPPCHQAPASL